MGSIEDFDMKEEWIMEEALRQTIPGIRNHRLLCGYMPEGNTSSSLFRRFGCCPWQKRCTWMGQGHWDELDDWADHIGSEIQSVRLAYLEFRVMQWVEIPIGS